MKTMKTTFKLAAITAFAAVALTGCFNSLVDGTCADGYEWRDGGCQLTPDGGGGDDAPDADPNLPDADPNAADARIGPDAIMCEPGFTDCDGVCTDLENDANSCGMCGHVCPTGICVDGDCVGGVVGRVILIGHDYRQRNASETRLLGNAIALPPGSPVTVAVWKGTATMTHQNVITTAIDAAELAVGEDFDRIDVDNLPVEPVAQVVLIMPQDGTAAEAIAAGSAWAAPAAQFIADGGVVIAVGGHNTVSEFVLIGAGLLDATYAITCTGDDLTIAAPTDALAAAVLSPYRAELSTSSYVAGRGIVVVESEAGDAVVIDAAGLP
jgi:hypothetical protein